MSLQEHWAWTNGESELIAMIPGPFFSLGRVRVTSYIAMLIIVNFERLAKAKIIPRIPTGSLFSLWSNWICPTSRCRSRQSLNLAASAETDRNCPMAINGTFIFTCQAFYTECQKSQVETFLHMVQENLRKISTAWKFRIWPRGLQLLQLAQMTLLPQITGKRGSHWFLRLKFGCSKRKIPSNCLDFSLLTHLTTYASQHISTFSI